MRDERINRVRVRTPEGVVFTFPLAGPVTRCIAWVLDSIAVATATSVVSFVLVWFALVSFDFTLAALTVLFFVISTGYTMAFEYFWRGQTPGKRVMRLRVVDAAGMALTPGQVVVRNLVRVVDELPVLYLVGGIAMMVSRRAQRLGDLAAGTIVVRHRPVFEPDLEALIHGKYNSLREAPHLAARLRQRVPPVLAAAAVDALVRREQLDPDARVALFGELAQALRGLVSFPPEIVAELPDEVFVRNVVEIVHTRPATAGMRGSTAR
ncbi:MAG: RDD family protein [Opitutaceae bacterium]|nr:RDD family protein [Opitutaceae bacterium]